MHHTRNRNFSLLRCSLGYSIIDLHSKISPDQTLSPWAGLWGWTFRWKCGSDSQIFFRFSWLNLQFRIRLSLKRLRTLSGYTRRLSEFKFQILWCRGSGILGMNLAGCIGFCRCGRGLSFRRWQFYGSWCWRSIFCIEEHGRICGR